MTHYYNHNIENLKAIKPVCVMQMWKREIDMKGNINVSPVSFLLTLTVEGAKGSDVKVYHVHTPFTPQGSTIKDSQIQMGSSRPGESVTC